MPDFVPEFWSKKMQQELNDTLVAKELTNTDWEGEIKQEGDTVHILAAGGVTIRQYNGNPIQPAETPEDNRVSMHIGQSWYFNTGVGKIKQVQESINTIEVYIKKGGIGMKGAVDKYILSQFPSFHPENIITPATALNGDNILSYFQAMSMQFDLFNIPDDERKVAVTPRIIDLMKKHFTAKATDFGTQVSRNGYTGTFDGWKVYKTNNIVAVNEDLLGDGVIRRVEKIIFGHPWGITYAQQISDDDIEMYRPQDGFGEAVKALFLGDAKVLQGGKCNGVLNAYY